MTTITLGKPLFKLSLRERPQLRFSSQPEFDLMLNGEAVSHIYHNMTGYPVMLPTPRGTKLALGEVSLSKLRREIAALNKKAKETHHG